MTPAEPSSYVYCCDGCGRPFPVDHLRSVSGHRGRWWWCQTCSPTHMTPKAAR
jgi:hypothetical protein